jgi:hypothetical protein
MMLLRLPGDVEADWAEDTEYDDWLAVSVSKSESQRISGHA